MTNEQKAAFINAQVIAARIELEAMVQTNREASNGKAPMYSEADFMALQEKYLITYNAVMTVFNNW